jgi:hypothetical protein
MKNLILSLVMLVSSFVTFSQVIEVEFVDWTGFNSGTLGKYSEVIDSTNYLATTKSIGGSNKYVINLTEKTVSRYFDGVFRETAIILSQKKDGNLIYMTINDRELSTGKTVISNVVINTNKNDKSYPKIIQYFTSTVTNTVNGFVAMK